MFKKSIVTLVVVASTFGLEANSADVPRLDGAWSGGGRVWLASGGKEYARCRASYSRRSKERYVVTAVCATPSVRVVQTASLRRAGDNRYTGTFLNREYGVSGTILVRVWGNRQTVRLASSSGWASLRLSRVLRR